MRSLFTLFFIAISAVSFGQNFSWTSQTSGVTNNLRDVYFTDNQTGWAVGDTGVILHTSDGGQTWDAQTSGTTIHLYTVYFIDSQTGWAAGHNLSNVLLKTTNGGTTWTEIPSSSISLQIRDISFGNASNGWLTTPLGIYASTDGGNNWTLQTINQQTTQQDVRVVSTPTDTSAYVGGFSKRTTPSNTYADVFATAESPTAAYDFLGSSVSNFKTTDLGILCIDFPAPNIGFAGGSDGAIYKLDFGSSGNIGPWLVNLDLGTSTIIWDLSFPTVAEGMFLTSAPNNMGMLVYHTSDSGNTWSMIPDSLPTIFTPALHSPDANTAWIVGSQGKIYKGTSTPNSIEELDLSVLINVFPNPTSGLVTVELNGEVTGAIDYILLDINGRQTSEGTWQKGVHKQRFEIDMTGAVNGLYILSISTSSGQNHTIRIAKN